MDTVKSSHMQLYNGTGQRLFINADERKRFLASANLLPPLIGSFCHTLVFTGCRISEVLRLSASQVHVSDRVIAIPCLKKRGRHVVREIPVPDDLLMLLNDVHGLGSMIDVARLRPLWPWSRCTAWRKVKDVMNDAGIAGVQATAKGLRHGYGRHAIVSGVQLHLLQKWMGHAHIKTTAIYANTTSPEEHRIAEKMW